MKAADRMFVTALVRTTEPELIRAARKADLGLPVTREGMLTCYDDVVILYQWFVGGVVWRVEGEDTVVVVPLFPHTSKSFRYSPA